MKRRNVHLVGIGGSGMSALAGHLLQRGDRVSGSDLCDSATIAQLAEHGAEVKVGVPRTEWLREDTEQLVHSAAVDDAQVEVAAARVRGIPTSKYANFLGREIAGRPSIAVAGTHGKTTVAGMIAHILRSAEQDPSVVIGGELSGSVLPGRYGAGPFVVEACEYDHSFLSLEPSGAVITNVEADHLDYFGSEGAVVAAFQAFLASVRGPGPRVMHESVAMRLDLSQTRERVVIVGSGAGVTDSLTFVNRRDRLDRLDARPTAVLRVPDRTPVAITLPVPGEHNLWNAALAASTCLRMGVRESAVESALRSFPGMKRRLERLGRRDGIEWYSDYAHHPTELRALRLALRERWAGRRLIVAFQPHQACRTRDFLSDFARELAGFDEVVFPGIYSVRESRDEVIRIGEELVSGVRELGTEVSEVNGLPEVLPGIERLAEPGDVAVLVGAGDIDELARPMRRQLEDASVARAG